MMPSALGNYVTITAAYWGFTLTDGALRMLVVLYFHQLGYSAIAIAMLFLFYEVFGIVTNLFGGWLGARWGLNKTMFAGLIMQIAVLIGLAQQQWLSIAFVMSLQALSGIAKDLNKMSAKSSLKLFLPKQADKSEQSQLYKWVSILTGSKNALKGAGFFIGGALLTWVGYQSALYALAGMLLVVTLSAFALLPPELGKANYKPKFTEVFSKSRNINVIAGARLFLFGARDIWFVVALPVFLQQHFQWQASEVGVLMASWVIGYGAIQALTPKLIGYSDQQTPLAKPPRKMRLSTWAAMMTLVPVTMLLFSSFGFPTLTIIIFGLLLFAVIFAINSALHSYWILAYARQEGAAMDVGFYYMANAGGRLFGTILSGLVFQTYGFMACIAGSALMLLASAIIARQLTQNEQALEPRV